MRIAGQLIKLLEREIKIADLEMKLVERVIKIAERALRLVDREIRLDERPWKQNGQIWPVRREKRPISAKNMLFRSPASGLHPLFLLSTFRISAFPIPVPFQDTVQI
jgi:hypothetical protein